MRTTVIVASLTLPFFAAAGPSAAQNYPWCAHYDSNHGGNNCGFATRQQCMEALSGNGGYCAPNPLYSASPAIPERPALRRRGS
jgi:hypothetical protein